MVTWFACFRISLIFFMHYFITLSSNSLCGHMWQLSLSRQSVKLITSSGSARSSRTKTLTQLGHVFLALLFITELSASGSFFTMPKRSKRSRIASERRQRQLESAPFCKKRKKKNYERGNTQPENWLGGDQEPIVYKYLLIKFFILYLFCPKP